MVEFAFVGISAACTARAIAVVASSRMVVNMVLPLKLEVMAPGQIDDPASWKETKSKMCSYMMAVEAVSGAEAITSMAATTMEHNQSTAPTPSLK